jgi:beta-glucosidase
MPHAADSTQTETAADPAVNDVELQKLADLLSLEDKLRLITGEDIWSLPALPQIGLQKINMSDGPVGVRGVTVNETHTSVLVPNPSALAATWDPNVARRVGELLGAQAHESGIHVLLAPTLNLHRTPLGGRHFECYSEDPLLTARTGAAYIAGVQSCGVAATAKHFVANDSEDDRMTYDIRVDERTLREVYLAPFEAAVHEARAWVVMSAYNSVNGHSMTENSRLQNDLLKGEWDFDGVVVSDWMAVRSTEAAVLGGTDIAMPGPETLWTSPLLEAIGDGRVPEAVLDDKVIRILRLAARVGALGDAPRPETRLPDDADAQIRAIGARAMVLLENRGSLLPLDPTTPRRVALIGPNAARLSEQGGGSAHAFPAHVVQISDGLREAFGDQVELTCREGVFTHRRLPFLPPAATTDPLTGEAGVGVEFRAADGTLLGTDRIVGSFLVLWAGLFPQGTAKIVLKAQVLPDIDGDHLLDVLGAGQLALTVDGQSYDLEAFGDGNDIIESMMRPPVQRIAVPARAGKPVDIELVYGADTELWVAGVGLGWAEPRLDDDVELFEAVADAAAADVAIVVVGTTDDIESEGFDRANLSLPGRSDELVARVAAANPNTIVVVNAGSPVLMPWRDQVAAVLWAWLPGQEGGAAVADVLTGAAEPGGRLPTTFPAAEADVPILSTARVDGGHTYAEGSKIGYRLWAQHDAVPAYPLGYGLGYTDWVYDDVALAGDAEHGLDVTVTVTNSGAREGRETVQVYLEPVDGVLFGGAEPLRLVGYGTVQAAAGTTAMVRIAVRPEVLARWDPAASGWTIVPGPYRVSVGRNVADLRISGIVSL